MRKIIVATFVSLDGVMQAPGGPQEDPTGGFKFGGWVASHFDEELGAALGEIFGRPYDLLKLKAEDGPDLLVQGSGDFLQTLWKHGLVDELSVLTFPVLLGKGKRLFGDSVAPSELKLVKAKSYPSGVIVANYVPDGEVKTGDFTPSQPSEAELEHRKNLN